MGTTMSSCIKGLQHTRQKVILLATDALLVHYAVTRKSVLWFTIICSILDLCSCGVVVCGIFDRNLFYTPLFMSVVLGLLSLAKILTLHTDTFNIFYTIVMIVNVIVTMGVWLVYATTIRSRPAPYIHPWREPEAAAEVITAFSNYSSNMSLAESIGSVEFEYKDNSSRLNESKTHVHDEFESKNNTPVEIKLEDEAMSISGKN